ncbi:MAG: YihY/virulence factor BrkB family protein [Usitatibacter sp.]
MTPRQFAGLFRQALRGWSDDNAGSMGAALAFYALFSMAPLLLLVISLVALVVDAEVASRLIFDQLTELLGARGAEAVQAVLRAGDKREEGMLAAAASLAMLVVGATSVLAELQRDLDRIWRYEKPASVGWLKLIRPRLWGFSLVLAIGFLLLISLVLSAAVSVLGSLWSSVLPGAGVLLRAMELALSFGLATGLFAMIYKLLPSASIAWKDVWVGAAITSILFGVGKWLIGLYIAKSAVASPFGAAGTLIVVIVWIYYSAQIFFLGAEFTRAYSLSGLGPARAALPASPDPHPG